MKLFLVCVSVLCLALGFAQEVHDKGIGILYKTRLEDQKQMIHSIIRSHNYPGNTLEKQHQVHESLQKYVSENVVLRWQRLSHEGCAASNLKTKGQTPNKMGSYLPAGCSCSEQGNCRCDGRAALCTLLQRGIAAMPDGKVSPLLMAGSGGRVAVTAQVSGTHLGSWMEKCEGAQETCCRPTGNRLEFIASAVYTFADGKISEIERIMDFGGLMDKVTPKRESERRIGAAITQQNLLANKRDYSAVAKFYADKVDCSCPFTKQSGFMSKAQITTAYKAFSATFPDLYCQVEGAFGTPTETVIRSRCTGTNKGRLWDGSAPTGRRVWYEMVSHIQFHPTSNLITKYHELVDVQDLRRQLQGKYVKAEE